MQYGICADPTSASAIAAAGFDFIELHVQDHLKPAENEEAFLEELTRIQAAPLPALAANSFLPAHLKVTGPDMDWSALEHYVSTAFRRAEAAGVQTIVFGSGGARSIPEGFPRDAAWEQLVQFGKMMGSAAEPHGVIVVVEPLNQRESNVLTTVGEAARYVREVDHAHVQLLADAYHWGLDADSYEDLVANATLLRHIHIATVDNRLPPGFEPCDFSAFFRALQVGGYHGPISIEARWTDVEAEAGKAYDALMALAEAAGF